jgi:tetratricopeptide (TPR) repeat protein
MGRKSAVVAGITIAFVLSFNSFLIAQDQQTPLTQKEVIDLVKHSKGHLKDAAAAIERRQVDFNLDPKVEEKLRKAGADDDTIQSVWKVSPNGRTSQKSILATATGAQLEVPPKEGMGFQTMQSEPDPDRRLRMVEEFEKQFPNSQILSYVYVQGARACVEKGDLNKAVEYGDKSLKLDPDNLPALLIVAISLAQPSMLNGSPSESASRSAKAQADAEHALKLLAGASKHAEETDGQFQSRKGDMESDANFALGMLALLGGDPVKAVEKFKLATTVTINAPAQYFYRLGEAYSDMGKNAEAIEAFKKASEVGKGTAMEQLANRRVAELSKK